jgi:hypothetical protein
MDVDYFEMRSKPKPFYLSNNDVNLKEGMVEDTFKSAKMGFSKRKYIDIPRDTIAIGAPLAPLLSDNILLH